MRRAVSTLPSRWRCWPRAAGSPFGWGRPQGQEPSVWRRGYLQFGYVEGGPEERDMNTSWTHLHKYRHITKRVSSTFWSLQVAGVFQWAGFYLLKSHQRTRLNTTARLPLNLPPISWKDVSACTFLLSSAFDFPTFQPCDRSNLKIHTTSLSHTYTRIYIYASK